CFKIRIDDFLSRAPQEIEQSRNIERMMTRREARQIFLRQFEQFNGRPQTPAVFCVSWMFEIFLKMDEGAGGVDQSFEKIIVVSVAVEPHLLQHVMRLVITLFVPAAEKRAIKRMVRYV